jgi:hypothetical protein
MFGDRVLRRIFGTKKVKVREGWRNCKKRNCIMFTSLRKLLG